MSEDLHPLVYCSRKALVGTPEGMRAEVEQILASARRNNVRLGVTGALLFNRACFAQVLEGARDAVERVFEDISHDLRHREVAILEVAPVEARGFPGWSMAYAGTLEDDQATFSALTLTPNECAGTVLGLLNALVLREEDEASAAP